MHIYIYVYIYIYLVLVRTRSDQLLNDLLLAFAQVVLGALVA